MSKCSKRRVEPDGRHLGAATRPNGFAYLSAVAQAADSRGFDGVLLPTGGLSEDTIVVASALLGLTRRLRFDEARSVAAEHADVYLSWGERPEDVAEKFADVRKQAAARGRRVRFGLRAHIIVRYTEEEAWREADRLIAHLTDAQIARAQAGFAVSESVGQLRMARLHPDSRDGLRIGRNLWAGVETFILSGYPHLEEACRTAELLFPVVGKSSPIFQTAQQAADAATARAGSAMVGRLGSSI